jgi:predicted GNAT superfamily acetyltransferase
MAAVFRPVETPADAERASALFDEIWRAEMVLPAEIIRAIAFAGGYAVLAHDEGRPVAGSVAFVGMVDGRSVLHSHIAGVVQDARDTGVGFALKHHQREWAASRGIATIRWSFDPLVRRNAWFNLARLGATVVSYQTNFYGDMHDGVNRGDPSDRLLVAWPTAPDSLVTGPVDPRPGDETVALPDDIIEIRATDAVVARRWRLEVREQVGGALERGAVVRGVDAKGAYVVGPPSGN